MRHWLRGEVPEEGKPVIKEDDSDNYDYDGNTYNDNNNNKNSQSRNIFTRSGHSFVLTSKFSHNFFLVVCIS